MLPYRKLIKALSAIRCPPFCSTGESATPTVRKWSVMNSTLCSQRYNVTVSSDELCAQLQDGGTGSCTVSGLQVVSVGYSLHGKRTARGVSRLQSAR